MKLSTKKLKIGLVIDDSLDRNDGVQQYVRALGNWLMWQGYIVHFLAGESKADNVTTHSMSRNIGVKFNGNRLTIPLPANKNAIKILLLREKYDVLHVQMPYSPLMAGRIISQAGPMTAIVGTFHILPYGKFQQYGNKTLGVVQKRQLRRLDAICSVSPAAQKFAKSHYGTVSRVIPNMIDTTKWKTPISPHPNRIVFLGRLVPRKGCKQLLVALSELPQNKLEEIELLIAGEGPERTKLEKFAKRQGLNNVVFLGYVDEVQKIGLLASADLAVFPSLGGESFGIVLIEAMAAGSGVVLGGNNKGYASVLGSWPETLFDAHSTTEISACIQKFLTNTSLHKQIHAYQQTDVNKYDVNVVGKQVLNLYHDALLHNQR